MQAYLRQANFDYNRQYLGEFSLYQTFLQTGKFAKKCFAVGVDLGETRLAGLQDTSESARPRVCNGPSKVFGSKFLPNSLHFTSKEDPNQGSKYFRFWIQIESRAKCDDVLSSFVLI